MLYKIRNIDGRIVSITVALAVFSISVVLTLLGIITVLIQGKDILFGIYMAFLVLVSNTLISYIVSRLFFLLLNILLKKGNGIQVRLDDYSE